MYARFVSNDISKNVKKLNSCENKSCFHELNYSTFYTKLHRNFSVLNTY